MSEIARLRKQIECECEAMWQALYGYASVASHEFINHRYEALGVYQDELAKIVGQEEAMKVVIEVLEQEGME